MATAPILDADLQIGRDELAPPVPATMEATGLADSVVEQLIFKLLYFRGDMLGRDISTALGLKFSVIEALVEFLKHQHLVLVKRSMGLGNSTALYALSEAGRSHARDYLDNNQYVGPAPVPLFQYDYFVRRQRRQPGWLTGEVLAAAYRRVVVTS